MPEGWDESPNQLQQMHLDARWVKKDDLNHYGYMNNICIDVEHGFTKRYAVTLANIHDSQMLPMLLYLRTQMIMLGQILPMQACTLKTYWILAVLKVAFTKRQPLLPAKRRSQRAQPY
jgi:hypothetical protein